MQRQLLSSVAVNAIRHISAAIGSNFQTFQQNWLDLNNCRRMAKAVADNGFPITSIIGFVDGKCMSKYIFFILIYRVSHKYCVGLKPL